MLRLEKIDPGNVRAVCELKLKKAQKHLVAANYISIIQTYAAIGTGCTTFPFAVCCDGKPVGFIIIGYNLAALYDYENYYDWEAPGIYHNNYNLWRLVIDKRYQNKGYGRAAIKLALDFIRTWPAGKAEYCSLSYVAENESTTKLYRSFGFTENGEMDGDEIIMTLKL